jgi:hypothetical protein
MQFSNMEELLQMHMDKPAQKRKKEYGLKVAKGIFNSADRNSDGFYGKRYRQWRANREFSYGTNSSKEFMDLMRIEGNQSYINIDWTPIKIAPKFVEILLGGFMSRREVPIVKAVDDMSAERKEFEKKEARYRMAVKDQIQAIEKEIGHTLESHKFIPEDEDELALYFDLEYRIPEEILFEKKIRKVLDDNDSEVLKRQLLRDIIDVNFATTKLYFDPNKNIRVKRCKPENMIYNVFESDNGKDISYIGEVYPMKLSAVRRKFNLDEETLFKLAQKASRELKRSENLYWKDSYKYTELRPYDDYSVLVFDFEVKTTDVEYSVKTENQFGNMLLVPKQGKPVAPSGQEINGEVLESKKMNIYNGIWVVETDIILKWDVAENIIRPYQNGVDAFFTYSVVCPNANGTLVPSMIEKAMGPIRQMIVIRLKMQQLIATMRPDGFAVDIAGLRDVDLGLGNSVDPLKLMRVYDQTGRVYWDSTGDDGERKSMPIAAIPSNANIAQLNTLIGQYNFELDRLREEMGVSEYKDASSVPVKTGLGVMQNQIAASNNATEYIYDAFSILMEQTCQKISMMVWDLVVFKATKFKEFEGGDDNVIDMEFDVKVHLLPDNSSKQELLQLMNTALQAGAITYEQVFKIKHIDDVKLAELYLARTMKRAKKEAQEAAQQNSQMNAQIQQQSAQQKMQGDAQMIQLEAQSKIAVNQSKGETDKDIELLKFASAMYSVSFNSGKEMPEDIKGLADNILNSAVQEKMQKQQQIQMAQQQSQQQAQQQGGQEGGQEQQPEGEQESPEEQGQQMEEQD